MTIKYAHGPTLVYMPQQRGLGFELENLRYRIETIGPLTVSLTSANDRISSTMGNISGLGPIRQESVIFSNHSLYLPSCSCLTATACYQFYLLVLNCEKRHKKL